MVAFLAHRRKCRFYRSRQLEPKNFLSDPVFFNGDRQSWSRYRIETETVKVRAHIFKASGIFPR